MTAVLARRPEASHTEESVHIAGEAKPEPVKVDVSVSAGQQGAAVEERKSKRALAPGSFLKHMLGSKSSKSNQPFSDLEITAQAFIFLLAGELLVSYQAKLSHVKKVGPVPDVSWEAIWCFSLILVPSRHD